MSGAADRLRLKRAMGERFDERQPNRRRFRATIGDGAGNVEVPGSKSYIYIRREGRSRIDKILNVNVPARDGMPIICGCDSENPDMVQVLAVDWQSIKDAESFTYLPMHHESHELLNPDGGDDVVWVQKTQIVPLAPFPTYPASMQIWVQADYYPWAAGWNRWPGGLTVDLSTYLPAAYSGVYVLISIDGATNALQYTAGTEYPYWPPAPEEDAIPAAPSGSVPIVAVYLWARANLLPNDPGLTTDSFETPGGGGADIWANWTEFLGAGGLANDAVIFYAAGGGLNSCQTTEGGGGRDTGVYQDFTVTPESCYQLRFWTRDDGGANDGAYRIYDVSNAADIVATTGTGVVGGPAWDEITQTFTAPAGCTTARVYFYCPAAGASQAWFDDVTVAEVPCSLSWSNFRDVRLVNSPMPGSVAPMPHDILSASHDDSTPAAAIRGDIITAQGVAPTWTRLAHPGAASSLLESTALESQWAATTSGAAANTVVRTDANTGIRPDRLGVGVPVPNQNGVIAQAETADPAGGGGGTARIYPKNDGGQTKYYFMDDVANVYEIAGIAEDVTVTVGGAGDFATIQDAVDWFKNWIIKGDCVIDVGAGAYDEAVEFASILIAPGAILTLEGDTRALVGISYVDGASCNQAGIANGGSGTVTLATNAARDQITVTMTVGNPDFSTAGIVNSDRILVFADDGNQYERVINSIDPGGAGTNVIEITVALPAGATLGNDGTAICLLPDRSIERTAAGPCVDVDGVKGVQLDGWYLETFTGAECYGIYAHDGANVRCENVAVEGEDAGFQSGNAYATLYAEDGACSAWNSNIGFSSVNSANGQYRYGVAVNCAYGFRANYQSNNYAVYGVAANCTTHGFSCVNMSWMNCANGTNRACALGYYADNGAFNRAASTNANNSVPGVGNYNPAPAAIPGYGNGNGNADIYAS